MIDDTNTEWKDLKNKYVRIKDIGKFQLPIEFSFLYVIVPSNVLILDVDDKIVKLRLEGNKGELHCSILKNGVLKEDYDWFSAHKYKFLRELTKWEILEFEVADYIGGFYDELENDFDSKIITKSKAECEYMKKSANFELEKYFTPKKITVFTIGLIITSILTKSDVFLLSSGPFFLFLILLLLFYFFVGYLRYRRRFQELIMKLETRILSDFL